MNMKKGPNWQGVLVMIGIIAWTVSNIHDKLTKPEGGTSWWTVIAPATIFVGMVTAIYFIAKLSEWVGRRSGLTK
jgi:hypothetical protein